MAIEEINKLNSINLLLLKVINSYTTILERLTARIFYFPVRLIQNISDAWAVEYSRTFDRDIGIL